MTPSNIQSLPPVQMKGDLLIVSVQDSVYPIIWQMDRATLRTAAFDVVQVDTLWQLRFKPLNDSPREIAQYTDRAGAVRLLNHIQTVLMGPSILMTRPSILRLSSPPPRIEQIILAGISFLLFVILIMLIPSPMMIGLVSSSVSGSVNAPASIQTPAFAEPGVPQSAEDLLNQQGGQ